MTEIFQSSMTAKSLAEFKVKCGLPDHMELIPANNDEMHTHHPGYCALYAYPFTIGYSFPLISLVDVFCHFYGV